MRVGRGAGHGVWSLVVSVPPLLLLFLFYIPLAITNSDDKLTECCGGEERAAAAGGSLALRNSDGHIPRASATAHPCACMACQQLVPVILSFSLWRLRLSWLCWAFAYAPARGFTA